MTSERNPMEGKKPGWHRDPSGKANSQAYWDGERWSGETREDHSTGCVIWAIILLVVVPIMILFMMSNN